LILLYSLKNRVTERRRRRMEEDTKNIRKNPRYPLEATRLLPFCNNANIQIQ